MSSSKRIAYCAAEQSRAAAACARESSVVGQPPGSARGPGPDAKVLRQEDGRFCDALCWRHVGWTGIPMLFLVGMRVVRAFVLFLVLAILWAMNTGLRQRVAVL